MSTEHNFKKGPGIGAPMLVGNTRQRLMTTRRCTTGGCLPLWHSTEQFYLYSSTADVNKSVFQCRAEQEMSRAAAGHKRGRQDNYGWCSPPAPAVGITFTWSDQMHLSIVQSPHPTPAPFSNATSLILLKPESSLFLSMAGELYQSKNLLGYHCLTEVNQNSSRIAFY